MELSSWARILMLTVSTSSDLIMRDLSKASDNVHLSKASDNVDLINMHFCSSQVDLLIQLLISLFQKHKFMYKNSNLYGSAMFVTLFCDIITFLRILMFYLDKTQNLHNRQQSNFSTAVV